MSFRIRRSLMVMIVLASIACCAPYVAAQEQAAKPAVKAGYLTCHVASGWGFIFGSSREISCTYSAQPNYTEFYTGSISKFGADIGYLRSGVILWAVLAPTTDKLRPGALEGHYAGATASVALGVGAGAHVLLGGFQSSIALQPVSIEAQNGLNLAAGIVALDLHFISAVKVEP